MSSIVTLTNGTQASYHCVVAVCGILEQLAKKSPKAVSLLREKCYNSSYNLSDCALDRKAIDALQNSHLISFRRNTNGSGYIQYIYEPIDEEVRKVVLCSAKSWTDYKHWLRIVNPINGSVLVQVDYPW